MPTNTAHASGEFLAGGDLRVNRLGFGAMRITGKGIWGEPADRAEAVRVLRRRGIGNQLYRYGRFLRTECQ